MEVPQKLAKDKKEKSLSVLNLAYANRDILINGVTNRYDASDAETFFYFNLLPKLQAHGLADNERVPGVKYRRSFLNRKGQAFFAEIERQLVLAEKAAANAEAKPKTG